MKQLYKSQGDKLFCDNPRTENGYIEVATCCPIDKLTADEVAEKLALKLNVLVSTKDRAKHKDDCLEDAVAYLLSIDSKDVPRALRQAVLLAYEV